MGDQEIPPPHAASAPRFCSCGTRLSVSNPGWRCALCERKNRESLGRPPVLDREVWDGDHLSAALATRNMGAVFRAYRSDPCHRAQFGPPGITQAQLAGWLGITQAQISRIECGTSSTDSLNTLIRWAQTLHIPSDKLWFDLPDITTESSDPAPHNPLTVPHTPKPTPALEMKPRRHGLSQRRKALGFTQEGFAEYLGVERSTVVRWESGETAPLPWALDALGVNQADDTIGPRISRRPLSRRIGSSDVEAVREMTSLFSRTDQRRGGGHGLSAVAAYLNSDVVAQLNGVYADESIRCDMLSAAGELAYLVGWMAFDNSEHTLANHYFTWAVELANKANDPPLVGHVLRAMAHQSLDLGLLTEAYDLATASVEGDRYRKASPRERSLLGVIHARSLAIRGETHVASSVLLQAEEDLSNAGPQSPEPSRVFFFSEASLAHETACALRDLGDLPGADENFRRSIELRDVSKFTRTHAVTLGYLGDIKARQGEIGEACAVWSKSLNSMQGVHSGRTRRVVAKMRAALLPLSREDAVARELEYRAVTYLADSSPS